MGYVEEKQSDGRTSEASRNKPWVPRRGNPPERHLIVPIFVLPFINIDRAYLHIFPIHEISMDSVTDEQSNLQ